MRGVFGEVGTEMADKRRDRSHSEEGAGKDVQEGRKGSRAAGEEAHNAKGERERVVGKQRRKRRYTAV